MSRFVLPCLLFLMGCQSATPPAETPPSTPGEVRWAEVTNTVELMTLAAGAAAEGKALVLDVRADWCVPCRELERETFADEAVERALAEGFVLARLDVTDASPSAEALQRTVGGTTLPCVALWPMNQSEAAAFASGEVPPPAKTVSTFVSAQELLPTLKAVRAGE